MSAPEVRSERRCFGGVQGFYRHASATCAVPMNFAVYRPPQAERGPVPVLYFLSGLTCTEENFTIKAGAQRVAARSQYPTADINQMLAEIESGYGVDKNQ